MQGHILHRLSAGLLPFDVVDYMGPLVNKVDYQKLVQDNNSLQEQPKLLHGIVKLVS